MHFLTVIYNEKNQGRKEGTEHIIWIYWVIYNADGSMKDTKVTQTSGGLLMRQNL